MVVNWTISVKATNREEFEDNLNEYGQEGWELVALIPQMDMTI